MKFAPRALLGIAIGCTLGAVQAVVETLTVAFLYQPLVLHPAYFYNARMYDGFTKLFTWIDPPAPTLSTLESFLGQGFAPKLSLAADLLLVNFAVGAVAGLLASILTGFSPERLRRDARRTATAVLVLLVAFQLGIHLAAWLTHVRSPETANVTVALRNAARNFLLDGTLLSLLVLAVSGALTYFLLGSRGLSPSGGRALAASAALTLLVAVVASAGATAPAPLPVESSRQIVAPDYNVIVISIDSLRADHLGAYGYARATSPTIDAIADRGVLFRNASSTTAWTLPGHMSMLTGRSLLGHGVVSDDRQLAEEVPTLAESLKGAGYATGAIVSAPYVEARYGFGQGFDEYDDKTIAYATHGESYKRVTAPLLQATAAAWLERHAGGKFFLFLHYWDVHYDYAPGPPYDTMFDPHYKGSIDGTNFYFNPAVHEQMDRADLAHILALYDGEIRLVDDHLAKLRATLERLGVADKTILVITSDHGEEFFEHGRKGHHRTLHDEILRVPFVMYVPRAKPTRAEVVMETSIVDIMPTVLGLVGVELPAGLDGADLSAVSYGDRSEWDRSTIAELFRAESLNVQVSLRRTGKKLIHHFNDRQAEAYDIASDPGELQRLDLADGFVPEFMAELTNWMNEKWSAYRTHVRAGTVEELAMDAETLERLKAMGYLDD
jgi:arylsulfatase A-like enzyme